MYTFKKIFIQPIDSLLNKITMYRLVLYYLIFLVAAGVVLSFLGFLSFNAGTLLLSTGFILAISWITNKIFAYVFEAPANVESIYITALILALIITPVSTLDYLIFAFWAAVLAMASKYILAIYKKHIFNPAAFAVAVTALTLNHSASWWVGSLPMLVFVLIGGLLIVRKLLRFDLVLSFIAIAVVTMLSFSFFKGQDLVTSSIRLFSNTPILFFAFIMITEPLTTPPTKSLRMIYGALVGFLFAPQIHIASIFSTPELALLVGNVFSYSVSPKLKLLLQLKDRIQITPDTYEFVFESKQRNLFRFKPGQYLEWTLGHGKPDTRGNRRYFTIASSPTESEIRMGVKFYNPSSSFKHAMLSMVYDDTIVASQLAGDFVLPDDTDKKIVFIAGGIGITPFRSMLTYLIDTNERRSIVMMYANKTLNDIAYGDVLDTAYKKLGIETVYTLSDTASISPGWPGRRGYITAQMIREEISDYKERFFYISGPHAMVTTTEGVLKELGIAQSHIKKDFFPGFV